MVIHNAYMINRYIQSGWYIIIYSLSSAWCCRRELLDLLNYSDDSDIEDYVIGEFLRIHKPVDHRGERMTEESLATISHPEVVLDYRFNADDITRLVHILSLPESGYICSNGTRATSFEAMCMLLYRFRYPCRLSDMVKRFHRSKPEISLILNEIIDDLDGRFAPRLQMGTITPNELAILSSAIEAKGCPLSQCFGFIDGTVRPICRPIDGQRLFFNGHKRVHALKYQIVTLPNGLIWDIFGPIEGRRHDSYLLAESGLLTKLNALPNGYCLFGDAGYPITPRLITPFSRNALNPEQVNFNTVMSRSRQCVEWTFSKIVTNFAFLDFRKNQKVLLQPVGKYYRVGTLLTNLHTCMYSSQTSMYFDCAPPTPEHYLAGNNC